MNQSIVFLTITAAAALVLGAAGCDKKPSPIPAAESKGAKAGGSLTVQLPAAQKQFLAIESAGAAQAGDVLALPGRVTFRPRWVRP